MGVPLRITACVGVPLCVTTCVGVPRRVGEHLPACVCIYTCAYVHLRVLHLCVCTPVRVRAHVYVHVRDHVFAAF